MGFIKAGFTGGFLGIVISIADIFINSKILEKLSSLGVYVASSFGKVCINTITNECTFSEKFTTILATIVGNTVAYFIAFSLISLTVSIIAMWLTPSKKEQQIIVQQPQMIQTPQVQEVKQTEQKMALEKRPIKRAKISKKRK
ncbi:MAG: hypothetical protein AABX23_04210 [Nanoarchaeota archaeon]